MMHRQCREHGLHAARRAQQVPGHGFGRTDRNLRRVRAQAALHRGGLGEIPQRRRSAMGVDVIHLVGVKPRVAQRAVHAARRAFAILARSRHVERVSAHAVAGELGVNFRAASPGMLVLFKH